MDYEIYHDESKRSGYWHGILLVPVNRKKQLLVYLEEIRKLTEYKEALSLKKVKKNTGKIYNCSRAWVQLLASSLIQQKFKKDIIYVGKKYIDNKLKNLEVIFSKPIGCKFILFREKDDHSKMDFLKEYASKIETTFRIGLKGGLHLLGSEESPINITKIHFDGCEHLKRNVDKNRILKRMDGLRKYCSFNDFNNIIDDRTSNHGKENSQHYNDCQLLQLTDLAVGTFRTILGEQTREEHYQIAHPINELIERYCTGYKRMSNSRWFKGFCMSSCYIENENWNFETLTPLAEETKTTQLNFNF